MTPHRLLAAVALAGALVWSLLLAQTHLAARASVLDRLESSLLDLRVLAFGRRVPPRDVLIAAIDDATLHRARRYPLPRRQIAAAVTALRASGARTVVLDMLFVDPAEPEDDESLIGALKGGATAVAAMVDFGSDEGALESGPTCEMPLATLHRATTLGLVNIAVDRSGVARHVPMLLSCGHATLPALSLKAVSLAARDDPAFMADGVEVGGVVTPLDQGRNLALRFYGPEGTLATVSLGAILDGTAPPDIARGRTVVIGATAHGAGDRYPTPFDTTLPGVEVMATAIANLHTGDALVRTPLVRRLDAGLALAMALGAAACMTLENVGIGLPALAALVAAWLAIVLVGFGHGLWFAMAMPLAAFVPSALGAGAGRLALGRWTERYLRRQQVALSAFQSPAMLARLTKDPDFLKQPVEREIAVLFIDLSGFTGLSERLGPQVARDLLEAWHGLVEEAASAEGGMVAAYMADGAMLVWGMAESLGKDARRAVRAALRLRAETLRWLAAVEPRTGPLGVKIGGHLGPAILSRLGHATHQHITAIGDTVNVAARLMEVAAEWNRSMALSLLLVEAARAQGPLPDEARLEPPVEARIRGRERPLDVCFLAEGACVATET